MGLLQKHPISACTRPVLRGAVSLAAADAGVVSASAGRQSSAASSSSHYHWQQSGPSSRSTGPLPRPLSRFADSGLPGGRGSPFPGRFSRSLSASRLGGDGGWSPMANGANGRLANGHAEAAGTTLPGPPPGGAPFGGAQASPLRRQGSREATPPPSQPAST